MCVCVCSNCCDSGFGFVFCQTVATLDSDKDVCVFDSTATDMASSDIQIVYVPSHLYHMLFELFKVRTLQLCHYKRCAENRSDNHQHYSFSFTFESVDLNSVEFRSKSHALSKCL